MQQSQPLAASQQSAPLHSGPDVPYSLLVYIRRNFIIVFVVSFITISLFIMQYRDAARNSNTLHSQSSATTTPYNKKNVSLDTKANSDTEPPPQNMTKVTVNGQNIPLPTQGSISESVTSDNSQTDIKLYDQSSTQDSSETSSSNSLSVTVDNTDSSSSDGT